MFTTRTSRRAIRCTVVSGRSHRLVSRSAAHYISPVLTRHLRPLVSGSAAVNGLMYGNLPGLRMCAGDNVVWYTFGLGTEVDIHGVFFEGNTFQRQKTTRDIVNVFPHTTAVVTMQPNTPGESNRGCACAEDASAERLELFRLDFMSTPLPRQTYQNVRVHVTHSHRGQI